MRFKRKVLWLFVATVLLAVGMALGFYLSSTVARNNSQELQQRYNLISKRVLIDNPNDSIIDFRPLRRQLETYINQTEKPDSISLYFEYLPTGSSLGVNQDKEIIGASLLKLPVVMQIYKYAEEGTIDLDEKVALKQEWLNSEYGTLYKKGAGYKISIREATTYALENSDNTAVLLLFDKLSQIQHRSSPSILDFVDVDYGTNSSKQVLIGSQSYATILKCLYFACYLNKDDSQAVLQKLTHSDSVNRLPLRIPSEVPIAHKIGSYDKLAESDCGIIYLEKRNYLLCVMVGAEDPLASKYIADLSEITYKVVSAQ